MTEQDPFDPNEPQIGPDQRGPGAGRVPDAQSNRRQPIAAPAAASSRMDPMYPFRVVYKRRWIAATAFGLVVAAVVIRGLSSIPVYEARVRLLIENERLNLVRVQDVQVSDRTSVAYYQTQYMILQSRSLARRTLGKLQAQGLTKPSQPPVEPLTFKNALPKLGGAVMGVFKDATPAPRVEAASVNPAPAPTATSGAAPAASPDPAEVDNFLSGLIVSPVPTSRLVDVRYRSTDPVLAARYANAIVQEYIDQNLEFKFLATKEAAEWLGNRLTDQRAKVQEAEEALQRYREQTGVLSVDVNNDSAIQKLDTLATAVTNARAARIEKEALFSQTETFQKSGASLDTLPAVLANTYVQQLKSEVTSQSGKLSQLLQDLGEKHPDVVAARQQIKITESKLQAEIGKVVESVRAQYIAAQAAERSMDQAFNEQKRQALALNKSGLGLAILQREADGHRQIYEMLTQRAKETDLTSDIKSNEVRIIDPAEVPRSSRGPAPMAGLQFGALWGLVIGIGLAFLVENLDSRIKTPDELSALFDVPFLGVLPEVPSKENTGITQLRGSGHYAESFRAVRTNLLFSVFEPGKRTVVVTSAGVSEGKTSVATNLAVAIAQMGQRVLLIDADLRRPRVHEVFDCPREPGLSELLVGSGKGNESVRPSGTPGLWVMPAGHTPPNPAELLGSDRFVRMLQHVEQRFDWVILDSPPVMPVTDAAVIAHEVSAVLFVAAADRTSRHAAMSAVATLQRNGARVVGTVLNRIDIIRNPYYYAAAYRKEYSKYYAAASNS